MMRMATTDPITETELIEKRCWVSLTLGFIIQYDEFH